MKSEIMADIERQMLGVLDNAQQEALHQVLSHVFWNVRMERAEDQLPEKMESNEAMCIRFLEAKKVEGCSGKTLRYYGSALRKALDTIGKPVCHMTTEDLRTYLAEYLEKRQCSRGNIDNIRRILSSFFSWLEEENYIVKSPMRRIHKIRTPQTVKETYTDEALELMRDHAKHLRDLAIIDLLASTGMRVGELVRLNMEDIDFENRECVVFGKGSKERPVYFDARTKIHLKNYLHTRKDENPALFVSLSRPYRRLEVPGVEIRLRKLGRELQLPRVHPHKFRRTLATRAIDKGMPIEQVQRLLGHAKIETTMTYAMVDQNNVKISHRRFIG